MTDVGQTVSASEAEATVRAIGGGQVDAFVVSDGGSGHKVFTLTNADRPYRIFVEQMQDGAATLSPQGVVLYANARLGEILARPRDTVIGRPLTEFAPTLSRSLAELQGSMPVTTTVEIELIDGEGGIVPALVGAAPLELDDVVLTCLTFTDLRVRQAQDLEITRLSAEQAERLIALREAQADLTVMKTHDALTGLPNRGLLVDRIERELAKPAATRRSLVLVLADIDQFRAVNEVHGHAVGNHVLQETANRLRAALGPTDTVARIAGDQFMVLAPEVGTDEDGADRIGRVVAELDPPFDALGNQERLTFSIGITVARSSGATTESLLTEADSAMSRAKALGGNRVQEFDKALGDEVRRRAAARQGLQAAIAEDRIVARYQPIVQMASRAIVGFEALARIIELDGSELAPADFISIAEASGLVVPLGARMLALACLEARSWSMTAGGGPHTVAVNLSPRQFQPGDLPDVVHRSLTESGLDPRCLHLELTETAAMEPDADTIQQLEQIRDLGVQIGLDDFGTGFASLTHLRRLPLTFVKIDQTFVQGLGVDREDERIVAAVVDLAANLDLRSVAEGIETEDQFARLQEFGCDEGQGYLFAKPMAPDDVRRLLPHGRRAEHHDLAPGFEPDESFAAEDRRRLHPTATVAPPAEDSGRTLSDREVEVLSLLASGTSTEAIGRELYLSVNTVRNHIQHILTKLDAHSRVEAVAVALRQGLISVKDI